MKHINIPFTVLSTVVILYFQIIVHAEVAPRYRTIEEAVRASGGTYGAIDTLDPDSANNFINIIFDQGLTNSDNNGNCSSMNIKPSIKINCALSVNKDAYYYYEGQKGEEVTIIVEADHFVPEINISDANGGMDFVDNKQKQNHQTVTKILPYTGQYIFEVRTRYYTETKEGEPFIIHVTSDTTHIQADIRRDNLIPGEKYSVFELSQNQSTTSRNFLVDSYVIGVYKNPYCSPKAYSCPISLPPNITISDTRMDSSDNSMIGKEHDAVLWLSNQNKYIFELNEEYQFEVSVLNTSNTNIPKNIFSFVAVKKLDETDISTSIVKVPSQKISIFTKIWNFIKNLFT